MKGIYSLDLTINGSVEEIIVDDLIPCDGTANSDNMPCFAFGKSRGEFWVSLLEKAWAKLHGSYCMVRLGSATITLPFLTGCSTVRIDHRRLHESETVINDFWTYLIDLKQKQ